MRPTRPTRRVITVAVLAGVLITGTIVAQPKPTDKPADKPVAKPAPKPAGTPKKAATYFEVLFVSAPTPGQTAYCPIPVQLYYQTSEEGVQVRVHHSGNTHPNDTDAPPENGYVDFLLNYDMDTTNEELKAQIFLKDDPVPVKAERPLPEPITVICGGMGEKARLPNPPPGVKLVTRAKRSGGPVNVGLHRGPFLPVSDHIIPGAQARVWIKGKFADPARAHTHSYDLPADIFWEFVGGKWHASWSLLVTEPLTAKSHYPGGEVPPYTYMEPVLLNHKGEVLRRMYHPH